MKTSKAVGIDLGTTNSVIAVVGPNGEIVCRTDRSGRKTFPSVVVYDRRSDSLKSGQVAFNRRGTAPEPIVSIKSHMGDSEFRATTGPLTLTPVEVASAILAEMKSQMQDYLAGKPGYEDYVVDRAVITIPAYFASNAREATTKAGELAGLKVEFTLQEPTSAVLYYCQKNDIDEGVFLVYDLGGGTFDVSVVKVDGPAATVLGIAGNNYLGGDNFDELLAYHLLKELQEDPDAGYDLDGFDPNHNAEDRQRLTKLKLVA
ncbi:MAG: Hsp70 family protein, partial [Bifidobacteriaceae bacterium]|nr:Hsp70 family protein [Bifidobacteriaceae bacterium]